MEVETIGGTPHVAVTNSNAGTGSGRGPHNLLYTSGSGTNRLTFELAIAAANAATNAGDILSIGAQSIALAGGTIKDTADGTTASSVVISSALGTAAGTLTVTA